MNQFPTDKIRSGNRVSLWTVVVLSLVIISARFVFPVSGIDKSLHIAWANIFFVISGMWVMRKILATYFSDLVTATTMIILVAGTNLFCLTTYEPDLVHPLFFLFYALILWCTINWQSTFKWHLAIFLGLIIALTVSIRLAEITCILIPAFWGIYNKNTFHDRWRLIKEHYRQSLVIAVIILLGIIWNILFPFTISNLLEANTSSQKNLFFFIAPYLPDVMFSFRKGWLIYTPVMIFSIIGFYFLARKNPFLFYTTFLFFIINLHMVASWSFWWGGESFGQRAMISSYPVLALPLGYFMDWLLERKMYLKISLFLILGFLVSLNFFQTWQYTRGIIDSSHMTRKYWVATFGAVHPDKEAEKYLLKDYFEGDKETFYNEHRYTGRILAQYDFDNPGAAYRVKPVSNVSHSGKYSYKLFDQEQFSPGINEKFRSLSKKDNTWIRASGYIYYTPDDAIKEAYLVITCNHANAPYKYKSLPLDKEGFQPGQWNKISVNYQMPFLMGQDDLLQVYFWYPGKKEIYVDDILIEILEPRE
jgi:hypothetical protein